MESTPRLHATIGHVLSPHRNWLDRRHLKPLAWMIVGLLQSRVISLTAWPPYVQSRAVYAQSLVRRFARWLQNQRIDGHGLYGPLMQQAIAEWGTNVLYLALDTSRWWDAYCSGRISLISRGRAIPIVGKVLQHPCSSVAYEAYSAVLDKAMSLLPLSCQVVFLADRGFADTHLMEHLRKLNWHWRIRLKSSFWIYRPGRHPCKANRLSWALGEAQFWHDVNITRSHYGPVHLALARRQDGQEEWLVVSDEPTTVQTFEAYGLRFDIEETFLDDKANGFQLESSLIRSAAALERLCLVLAITTLYLVSQGVEVLNQGKRRWVDPHWFRGQSYLKIGWHWVTCALTRGYELITRVYLPADADPEPAMASKRQYQTQLRRFSALAGQDDAA
jgi:Transposase DDE domain